MLKNYEAFVWSSKKQIFMISLKGEFNRFDDSVNLNVKNEALWSFGSFGRRNCDAM